MKRTSALLMLAASAAIPASGQGFGGAVAATNGQIIVGETGNRAFPGMVYLYEPGPTDTFVETARLSHPESDGSGDGFGSALATDGHHLVVGSPFHAGASGSVAVFGREPGEAWHAGPVIRPEGDTPTRFGRAVAVDGSWIAVGSAGVEESGGRVYLFSAADHRVAQVAVLSPDGTDASFGSSVALEGDDLLVGAPGEADGLGAVYAFRRTDSGWSQTGRLAGDQAGENARFGSAIALRAGEALVGATGMMRRAGGVFVLEQGESGEWSVRTALQPVEATGFGSFGSDLALFDGGAWVGMPGDGQRTGAVYRFEKEDGRYRTAERLAIGDVPARGGLGGAIAVSGRVAAVGLVGMDGGEGGALGLVRTPDGWSPRNIVINEGHSFASVTGGRVRCESDEAADFPCKEVDMLSFLSVEDIGGRRGIRVNDIWGWTDPETGHEWALVGRTDGTSFVDVTDPVNPFYAGDLPMTEGANVAVWRDIKVYRDHAFIVSDGAGPHGMQVFDLGRLRAVSGAPVTFTADALYKEIASAHNVVINEDTGFAYSVGSSMGGTTCGGGLHMIDIREPKNPTFAGCFADPSTGRRKTGYSHDAQCVVYNGPDVEHRGREVCFGSNETALSIADVTEKGNPRALAMATYPAVAYTHQGWLTEDHRYFYINDEGDEPAGLVAGTRTLIWDVSDLDDPVLAAEHISDNSTSTDHNLYIRGNLMYQSNYVAGLRILDISDPENPVEVAYFDTVPYGKNDQGTGGGSWSNYPYFPSGNIVVTSGREGLFVVRKADVDI